MTGKRRLTDDEIRLWNRFTAGVERIANDKRPTKPKPQSEARDKKAATINSQPKESSKRAQVAPTPSAPDLVNTDRRTQQRLKRGQIEIEGRLDLHGRTQLEAHDALGRFLQTSSTRGLRCVLIVTGKGPGGQGVLRQMVPRWLAEKGNRERVIAYCPAHARHGGDGALYVLVRRRRGGKAR